jgi:hypothetical protein
VSEQFAPLCYGNGRAIATGARSASLDKVVPVLKLLAVQESNRAALAHLEAPGSGNESDEEFHR